MVICPTPIEYWVATTDAMDLNFYEKVKKDNPHLDLYEVLVKCAGEFPHGVGHTKENF